MCAIDLEPATIWREIPHVARVPHRCASCHATIPRGAPYLNHSSLFDGAWYYEAMCAPCWFVREEFVAAHGQYMIPGALWDSLEECIHGDRKNEWRPHFASLKRRYRTRQRAAA